MPSRKPCGCDKHIVCAAHGKKYGFYSAGFSYSETERRHNDDDDEKLGLMQLDAAAPGDQDSSKSTAPASVPKRRWLNLHLQRPLHLHLHSQFHRCSAFIQQARQRLQPATTTTPASPQPEIDTCSCRRGSTGQASINAKDLHSESSSSSSLPRLSLHRPRNLSTCSTLSSSASVNIRPPQLHLRLKQSRSTKNQQRMILTNLPPCLFLEIISYLTPKDIIRCRALSSTLQQALLQFETSIALILDHFPRSREGRLLRERIARGEDVYLEQSFKWADVYARLARRYYYLGHAKPRTVTKIPVHQCMSCLRGVTPWNKVLSVNEKTMPVYDWEPMWTLDPDQGLLVYPTAKREFMARDLESGRTMTVPFPLRNRVVRRTRLKDGILVFEWHVLNSANPNSDGPYKHYTTSFDVKKKNQDNDWEISFRAEWNLHPAGSPMSHRARFFSTHNKTHYAVYIWEPLQSPWADGDPSESLAIWEFGLPTNTRASKDNNLCCERDPATGKGPLMVRDIRTSQMKDLRIAQDIAPSLRGLAMDSETWDQQTNSGCGHIFLIEEEHVWATGPHSNGEPPRQHTVKSVGVPVVGEGPIWLNECLGFCADSDFEAEYEVYPYDTEIDSLDAEELRRGESSKTVTRLGEGQTDWPGKSACWRHNEFPYITVSQVHDESAEIKILARQCFLLETISVHARPRLWVKGLDWHACSKDTRNDSLVEDEDWSVEEMINSHTEHMDQTEVPFQEGWWDELMGKRFICGDERWIVGEDTEGNVTILEF